MNKQIVIALFLGALSTTEAVKITQAETIEDTLMNP